MYRCCNRHECYVITLCYFEWTAKKIVVAVYETFVAKKNYPKICAM